jgi:hypothetical protein
MNYQIPDDVMAIYDDLDFHLSKAITDGNTEVALRLDKQIQNLAQVQMDKALNLYRGIKDGKE